MADKNNNDEFEGLTLEELKQLDALYAEQEALEKEDTKIAGIPVNPATLTAAGISAAAIAPRIAGGVIEAGKAAVSPIESFKNFQAESQLRGMQKNLGIKGTETSFVPQEIKNRIGLENKKIGLSQANLRSELSIIEKKNINDSVNRIASSIKQNKDGILKQGGLEFQRLQAQADAQGFNITTKELLDEVIDPAIKDLKAQGGNDRALKELKRIRKQFKPRKGAVTAKQISSSQAMSIISKVKGADPFSPTAAVIQNKFHNFLEINAPAEVKQTYANMNTQYKEFADVRRTLFGSAEKSSEFNNKAVKSMLHSYAKNQDAATAKLITKLSKGSPMIKKIEGLDAEFARLKDFSNTRANIQQQIKDFNVSKNKTSFDLGKQSQKAQQLVSKATQAKANINAKSPGGLLRRLFIGSKGSLGRNAVRAVGPLGLASEAARATAGFQLSEEEAEEQYRRFINDPARALAGTDSGGTL